MTVEDHDGLSTSTTFNLTVDNVPPAIAVDEAAVAGQEGTTITNSGTFSDVGDDVVTLTSDLGTVTANGDGTWDWSYLGPDGYTTQNVTVTATDSEGAQTSATFSLEIYNVPPVIAVDVVSVTVGEGATATVTGTMSDQAVPEDTITVSATVGTITTGTGSWQWTYVPTDGPDESQTVTVTANDGDGGINATTFNLVVDNVAPTVSVSNVAVTVNEGVTATNTVTVNDVGADTIAVTASRGNVSDNGDGTWSWSLATQDGPDDSGTITITATDSDGAQSTTQFAFLVDNVPPVVAVDQASVTIPEGVTASNTGTYSDAGPADATTLTVSVGTIVDNGDGTWSWSFASTDGADDSQTVTVTVADSEGAQSTATFDLVVTNVAPSISVAQPTVTADEGTTATNTITITDPGVDTVQSLTTSVGTTTDNGDGTWSWVYVAPNGPATETVTVTATDSDGDSTTLDFTLQTSNVAPVVAADVPSITINEGETATVTGTMSDQAVPEDAITITSSLDAAGASIIAGSGTWAWIFTAADGEGLTQTVTITAEDADAGVAQTTFDLVVNNLPANLTVASSMVTVDEGSVATNSGTFADPGDDTVTFAASLGTVTDAGGGNWSWDYPTTDGPTESQTVTITATDSDGATSTISFNLAVDNVAPTIATDNANVSAAEGSAASNTGTFADIGADAMTLSADRGTVVDNGDGTWSWSLMTVDGPDESGSVTVTVTDADGAATDVSFNLTVTNVAPTIAADQAGVTVEESTVATMTGTTADVGDDILTLSSSLGAILDNGDGTWSWSFDTTNSPGDSVVITVTAEDHDGLSSSATFNLTLANVPPTVTVDEAAVAGQEGTTITNSGTFADAGGDAVTLTSDIGTVTANVDGTWDWSHDAADGYNTQNVTVTATDSDGGQSTVTFSLEIYNVPPQVSANVTDVTVGEGLIVTVSGTMSDQAGAADTLTLSASIGTVAAGAGTWQWTYPTTDGPDDSQTVTITVNDGDGGINATTFDLIVDNVAPTMNVANATVTVDEGATATNSGTVSDIGVDTVSLTASRGDVLDNGDGTWSWSFGTLDGPDDSGAITVTATDSDGAQSTVQFSLDVNNVAPTIAVDGASVTVTEGSTATYTGTYADAGPADAITLSSSVGAIVDNGDGTWSWSFVSTDGADDSQTVTVTITDSEGAQGSATFDLVVTNVAPAITVAQPTVTVAEGTSATNTITVTDVGDDSVQSLTTSIGSVIDNGDGTWSWSHLAPNGPNTETVTITATDSDGDSSTLAFTLQTNNVEPVVTVDVPSITINEGETATVTGTMSDAAIPEDAITITSSLDAAGATIAQSNGTWTWTFPAADGEGLSQTVTITAADADGGVSQTTFQLIVNNLAAELTVANTTVSVNEGQTATNSGNYNDPGDDVVTLSASLGTVVDAGGGNWSWNYLSTDGPSETQVVTITATDSDGVESTITFDLNVDNVAPTVAVDNATVFATEGTVASNTGTLDDVGTDILTLTADRGSVVDNGNGTWNWSLNTVDGPDESGLVTITVTDADGAVANASFNVTVTNVAPTIAVDQAGVTVNESVTATMTGTYADVGVDVVSLSSSLGTIVDNGNDTWSWSFASTDGPAESQVVTVTAEDHDGLSTSATFNLTVQNVAPTVDVANATVTVTEGDVAANSGNFADIGDDTVAITASVGTPTDNGDGTWSWSFATTDGPDESQTVTVTATDSDGAQTTTTFELVVENVPPGLAVDNATVSVGEGGTAMNSGTIVDIGDVSTFAASAGVVVNNADGTWSWSLATTDGVDESQSVTVTATDEDGDVSTVTFDLVVDNLPATLTVDTEDVIVSEGATATNTGTYADPGVDTVLLAASIGTVTDTGGGGWAWSFATTDGPTQSQQVTITATDSDGAISTTTFDLLANNVEPTLGIDNATITVSEGALAGNSGVFGDIGDDTVTVTASDGTVTQDDVAGTWQWSFQSTDGVDDSRTVTITATDEDGGSAIQQFDLVVNNLAPTVSIDNATTTAEEGTTATNSGTFRRCRRRPRHGLGGLGRGNSRRRGGNLELVAGDYRRSGRFSHRHDHGNGRRRRFDDADFSIGRDQCGSTGRGCGCHGGRGRGRYGDELRHVFRCWRGRRYGDRVAGNADTRDPAGDLVVVLCNDDRRVAASRYHGDGQRRSDVGGELPTERQQPGTNDLGRQSRGHSERRPDRNELGDAGRRRQRHRGADGFGRRRCG